jgi:hypothetical protein
MHLSLDLISPTNALTRLTLSGSGDPIRDHAQLVQLQRRWGCLGYHPPIPAGGWLFPLEAEAGFDWTLLGGERFEHQGTIYVRLGGMVYTRRDLAPEERTIKGKKEETMPAAIRYSRGARPADTAIEASGDNSYVTLAVFRGRGQIDPLTQRTQRAGA